MPRMGWDAMSNCNALAGLEPAILGFRSGQLYCCAKLPARGRRSGIVIFIRLITQEKFIYWLFTYLTAYTVTKQIKIMYNLNCNQIFQKAVKVNISIVNPTA